MPPKEDETKVLIKAEMVDVQMEGQEEEQLFSEEVVDDEPEDEKVVSGLPTEGHKSFFSPPSEHLSQRPSMEVVYSQPAASTSTSEPPPKKPHKE